MKLILILVVPFFVLLSCSDQISDPQKDNKKVADSDKSDVCPPIMCTQEFRSVNLKFKDASGPVRVSNLTATIKRTGTATHFGPADGIDLEGVYAIVTDSDTKSLIPEGDTIVVSAVNPKTKQKKVTQLIVAGGKCACHIEKKFGPEEVVF